MRFLGVGDSCDLGAMYIELVAAGHEVRVHIGDPDAHDTCAGLVTTTTDWKAELDWVRDDGIVIFETAHHGDEQDDLRRRGYRVIGGSSLGDRLEGDRELGQSMLRAVGMQLAPTHGFGSYAVAADFVRAHPGRYVLKQNGSGFSSARTYIGERSDGSDLLAMLSWQAARWPFAEPPSFVLMEHRDGVEVGVGAFFNGKTFLRPACLDWEHKRFFPGDLGELTGEMGTLVTYRDSDRLFDASLARLGPLLSESGYVGYINLNMIVNGDGIWPLELTCRFGYPGFAILRPLQDLGWDALFLSLIHGSTVLPTKPGYCAGVVVTVPPFPQSRGYAELSKGMPIDTSAIDDMSQVHWGEVALVDGTLVTSGQVGYIGVVTGVGDDAAAAIASAYVRTQKLVLPLSRYRNDIGQRFIDRDHGRLIELGWMG